LISSAASTQRSKIGLRPGQSVALRDLLYAVLLKSANDASVVGAEGVSGSEIGLADQRNLKSRAVGRLSARTRAPPPPSVASFAPGSACPVSARCSARRQRRCSSTDQPRGSPPGARKNGRLSGPTNRGP